MRKDNPLLKLIKGTPGNYVKNQKFQVFLDKRTRRNRTRSDRKRRSIEEQRDAE